MFRKLRPYLIPILILAAYGGFMLKGRMGLHATDPATVALAQGKPQLVEFFAFWWMACQAMGPVVHGLEKDYGDKIGFNYLDVEDPANQPLADRLGARGQPLFYLLDGQGEVVESWAGPVGEATLRAAFDRLLAAEGG